MAVIELASSTRGATVASAPVATGRVLNRIAASRRSAIWAAWGDALGFPIELARDSGDVERRVGTTRVETTVAWRRRVGGRMGVEIDLPPGMYSDDTQLRLAVSRSIRGPERFDVEVFSKIELPVFLSYGFGVGRGTRAAAQSLTKRGVRWYSNFFDARGTTYLNGGGNGAAMRIQPHVWAASEYDADLFLPNVVRDAVTTHGHVRGILGAALHAVSLAVALDEGAPPEPARWEEIVRSLESINAIVAANEALSERWLPAWERGSRVSLSDGVSAGIDELLRLVAIARGASMGRSPIDVVYAELADAVGGRTPATRGSGTISSVLSLWLAHHGATDPAAAVRCAANLLGSDTDTVASMAGALVGVNASDEVPGPLLDSALIAAEAERLAVLATGGIAGSFAHPDPLHWQPPKTQADALGLLDGRMILAGLGAAREESDPVVAQDGALWQWVTLEHGQTVFVKRRAELPRLAAYVAPQPRLVAADGTPDPAGAPEQQQLPTEPTEPPAPSKQRAAESPTSGATAARRQPSEAPRYPDSVEEGVALVVRSRFEAILMSRLLMHYARQEDGVVKAAVFATLTARALRAYDQRGADTRSRS